MANDLLQSLVNMTGGVASPVGQPVLQGENPLSLLQGHPGGTIPAATPAPMQSVNPAPQVKSLEEMLFSGGI